MFATLRANLLATVLGLAAVIFAVIAIVQSVEINGFLWWDGLKEKNERLEADNKELIDGAEEAKRLNEQQIQRIERDQEKVNETRLADLTARLERLRSELRSKAAPRNPGSPQAGPDGKAPGGADGEAGLCLTPEELLRAAENEERHDQLISWIEQQLKIER
jgi:hypothetical protein